MTGPSMLAEALIREYLHRHALTSVLEAFNEVRPKGPDAICSKSDLVRSLGIERPVRKNKERGDAALKSCLEVVAEYLGAKSTAANDKSSALPKASAPAPKSSSTISQTVSRTAPSAPTIHAPVSSNPNYIARAEIESVQIAQNAVTRSSVCEALPRGGVDELVLEELEDADLGLETGGKDQAAAVPGRSTGSLEGKVRDVMAHHISMSDVAALKNVVFGNGKMTFNSAWKQGFFPSSTQGLEYGITQTAGGPCGVLASVQAFLLRHLLYVDRSWTPSNMCSLKMFEQALIHGMADILWQAGGNQRACVAVVSGRQHLSAAEDDDLKRRNCRTDGVTELLSLFECQSREQLLSTLSRFLPDFIKEDGFGVPMLLYSAILSRGIENVTGDMVSFEGENPHLMGAHNYCSQEMVNLLLVGKAVGNVFDGSKDLDGSTLQGISSQGCIGFLTLFEHYGSMEVGTFLKEPEVSIWVVCSESHFSVLFSPKQVSTANPGTHDLHYYDGLSKQDEQIILTVTRKVGTDKLPVQDFHKDMTPPLEHCIRTRWPGASVDWNGTDPIL
jgi:hypothetical protein